MAVPLIKFDAFILYPDWIVGGDVHVGESSTTMASLMVVRCLLDWECLEKNDALLAFSFTDDLLFFLLPFPGDNFLLFAGL